MINYERIKFFPFHYNSHKYEEAKEIAMMLKDEGCKIDIKSTDELYKFIDKSLISSDGFIIDEVPKIDAEYSDIGNYTHWVLFKTLINDITMDNLKSQMSKLETVYATNYNRFSHDRDFILKINCIFDGLYSKFYDRFYDKEAIYFKTLSIFITTLDKVRDEGLFNVVNSILINYKEFFSNLCIVRHKELFELYNYNLDMSIDDELNVDNILTLNNSSVNDMLTKSMLSNVRMNKYNIDNFLSSVPLQNTEIKYLTKQTDRVYYIFETLQDNIDIVKINSKFNKYTHYLNEVDRLNLERLKRFKLSGIYIEEDRSFVYFLIRDDLKTLYLVLKDNNTKKLVLMGVTNENYGTLINDSMALRQSNPIESSNKFLTKILTFKNKEVQEYVTCTEGFRLDKDGNITFSFDFNKKNYMDEYMEIHQILVENDKNNNIEGMKQNLVHMYLLMEKIQNEIYKRKINIPKELIKAKSFVTNDFKFYLRKIQKQEPKFEFYEYLLESDYARIFIRVTPETVTGVKKILRALLF